MSTASKRTRQKAEAADEKTELKDLPKGRRKITLIFHGLRLRRTFKMSRVQLQTDGVTTVLNVFELATGAEYMFPFYDIKEVRQS